MKLRNKVLAGLLTINLALAGPVAANLGNHEAYAAETVVATYESQRPELERALSDVPNVLASEVYNNYVSQALKADYEAAVDYGSLIWGKGEEATVKELVDATNNINRAKAAIYKAAENVIQKQKLLQAIEANEKQAQTAEYLMTNYPATVKNIRGELEAILQQSKALVAQARQLYNSL